MIITNCKYEYTNQLIASIDSYIRTNSSLNNLKSDLAAWQQGFQLFDVLFREIISANIQ